MLENLSKLGKNVKLEKIKSKRLRFEIDIFSIDIWSKCGITSDLYYLYILLHKVNLNTIHQVANLSIKFILQLRWILEIFCTKKFNNIITV